MPDIIQISRGLGQRTECKPLFNDNQVKVGICKIDNTNTLYVEEDFRLSCNAHVYKKVEGDRIRHEWSKVYLDHQKNRFFIGEQIEAEYVTDDTEKREMNASLEAYDTMIYAASTEGTGDGMPTRLFGRDWDEVEIDGHTVLPLRSVDEDAVIGIAEFSFLRGGAMLDSYARAHVRTVQDAVMTAAHSVRLDRESRVAYLERNPGGFRNGLPGTDARRVRFLLDRAEAARVDFNGEDGYPLSAGTNPRPADATGGNPPE